MQWVIQFYSYLAMMCLAMGHTPSPISQRRNSNGGHLSYALAEKRAIAGDLY